MLCEMAEGFWVCLGPDMLDINNHDDHSDLQDNHLPELNLHTLLSLSKQTLHEACGLP